MKLKPLRDFIKSKYISRDVDLRDQQLVIDGEYLTSLYKKSFQFILGGEYDRYASYLKTTLSWFIEAHISCYVVFKGAMDATNELRKEIHQKIITRTDAVAPGRVNEYCEPIFVKDVIKEVLDELGIPYFVCRHGGKQSLFSVARHLNCPILTPFIEYTIFRVSCISPNSIIFNKENKTITCKIRRWQLVKAMFPASYHSLAILISIYSDDNSYHKKIPGIIGCQEYRLVPDAAGWIRRKDKDYAIGLLTAQLHEEEKCVLLKNISEVKCLFYDSIFAIDYFTTRTNCQKQTFAYLVASGKIAVPYINLKSKGTFSGSWLIVDRNKPDAMLSALDIVTFAYARLTGQDKLTITFIGRQDSCSNVWRIHKHIKPGFIVDKNGKLRTRKLNFRVFLHDNFPKFDNYFICSLRELPENSWLIIITLWYYNKMTNMAFADGAHAVLLSYVILSVVSDKIGIISRNNNLLVNPPPNKDRDEKGVSYTDCLTAASNLVEMFYVNEKSLIDNYSRAVLHSLAEFQHCLQHMNYLNDLCGEFERTCYHKSINMTFIYNVLISLDGADSPVDYIKRLVGCAPIFDIYKHMFDHFLDCQKDIEQVRR